jgi:hypothetical protein
MIYSSINKGCLKWAAFSILSCEDFQSHTKLITLHLPTIDERRLIME